MPEPMTQLPHLIHAVDAVIKANADEIAALDQAIGDGDHIINVQRGIEVLQGLEAELSQLDWAPAFQKIGMSVMSSVGGASGSLYGTLFLTLGKQMNDRPMNLENFSAAFAQAVEAVKARGKAGLGEKTMLDVLIPVAECLQQGAATSLPLEQVLETAKKVAAEGLESTRDMLATKGRASFLGERARGHLDAGAKTSQLAITTIANELAGKNA